MPMCFPPSLIFPPCCQSTWVWSHSKIKHWRQNLFSICKEKRRPAAKIHLLADWQVRLIRSQTVSDNKSKDWLRVCDAVEGLLTSVTAFPDYSVLFLTHQGVIVTDCLGCLARLFPTCKNSTVERASLISRPEANTQCDQSISRLLSRNLVNFIVSMPFRLKMLQIVPF